MPKEARHHPHHKDTETPTDGVETPATDDTAAPEPAKNQRRYAFLSRHISTLRDLRLSGILTIFSSIAVRLSQNVFL